MSLVSVIIPNFNQADFLREAIESVLAQTYRDLEIIVADDGSTDYTSHVVAQFGEAVTFIQLPHRGLPAATRNSGLHVASGEFVAFLDADDLFLPHKLSVQMAAFASHPEAGMIYSDGQFFRDVPRQQTGHVQDGLPTPSGQIFADLLRGNMLAPPVVLIRRSCLDHVGPFDEHFDLCMVDDFDLWLRIAAEFPVSYLPGDVAAIRRHDYNMSRDVATLRRRHLHVLAKMDNLYPDLMFQYPAARHEGYARSHGAVALAEWHLRHLGPCLVHGFWALSHMLQMPGLGSRAFTAWLDRHRMRKGAN